MVNKVVLDYLKKYKDHYKVFELKKKILSSGYSKQEVEEAMVVLGLKKPAQPTVKSATVKPTKIAPPEQTVKSETKPVRSSSYSKWLKFAAFCGILIPVFGILFSVISGLFDSKLIFFIFTPLNALLGFFFFYGFVVLGKKYNKKMIKIVSWILIVTGILFVIFQILVVAFPDSVGSAIMGGTLNTFAGDLSAGTLSQESLDQLLTELVTTMIVLLIIAGAILLFYFIMGILFGISLIKLKENVKYAKITGILIIVGVCTAIIGIGVLILFAAYIFEIILLFKASKDEAPVNNRKFVQ